MFQSQSAVSGIWINHKGTLILVLKVHHQVFLENRCFMLTCSTVVIRLGLPF